MPRVARRFLSTLRHRRGLDPSSRAPWFLARLWTERPHTHRFISDHVLCSPLLAQAMGEPWLAHVRSGFLAGENHATQTAFAATAVVALDDATSRLAT